jgi:hypothetical protein
MAKLGTAKELAALEAAVANSGLNGAWYAADLRSLYLKLTKPKLVANHAPMGKIESALVEHSDGKVIRVTKGGMAFWIIQAKRYGDMGATVEDAVVVGKWLAAQHWLKATYTVDSLVRQWPNYLARAKAEANKEQVTDAWTRPEYEG